VKHLANSRRALLVLIAGAASVLSGCKGGLTLGPTVEKTVVLVKPGQPIQVLQNVTVRARSLENPEVFFDIDIGGWIAMPPEQFDELMNSLPPAAEPAEPSKADGGRA